MKRIEALLRAIDRFQQRHAVLGFPFGVLKKYGDDQGGKKAALLAHYGFLSLFPLLLLFTVVVIYMVLAVLYEHLGHPLTILTALPLAGFGALLVLLLMDQELNIFSFVGIILLVGLVKKNGIMMVDFALTRQRAGLSPEDAIVEASLVRLRPIMMTTMAAIMGALPIALGQGASAELRQPLGVAGLQAGAFRHLQG